MQARCQAAPQATERSSDAGSGNSAASTAGTADAGSSDGEGSGLDTAHSNGTVRTQDAPRVSALSKAVAKAPTVADIGSDTDGDVTADAAPPSSDSASGGASASESASESSSASDAEAPGAFQSFTQRLASAAQSVRDALQPSSASPATAAADSTQAADAAEQGAAKAAPKEGELALSVHRSIDEVCTWLLWRCAPITLPCGPLKPDAHVFSAAMRALMLSVRSQRACASTQGAHTLCAAPPA